MGFISIPMADAPRGCGFPWRVDSLAYTEKMSSIPHDSLYVDKMGVCVRLFSGRKAAVDRIGGTEYTKRFPNVCLKMPGVVHCFGISETRRTFEVIYSEKTMRALMTVLPFPRVPIWEADLRDVESRLIGELIDLMEHSMEYGVADRIDLLAFQLTESLLMNGEAESGNWYRARIMSIVSYFKIHFNEGFDLDALLKSHGMSRSTFVRHWREYFELSPGQYLLDLKLKEARRMLLEMPHMTISDISRQLNFSEPNYFCSVFRKHFGRTPLDFRRGGGARPSC